MGDISAEIMQTVCDCMAKVLEIEIGPADLDIPVTELPMLDSLMLVEAIIDVEDVLNIRLDEDDLFMARTVRDLCTLVERTLQSPAA
jgi:acyl carrier protein